MQQLFFFSIPFDRQRADILFFDKQGFVWQIHFNKQGFVGGWYLLETNPEKVTTDFHKVTNQLC